MPVDYFLKLDGIEGESTDEAHAGEIELKSCSLGMSNPTDITSATGGGGTGRVCFQDIQCTSQVSKATPKLAFACASGKHIPTGKLTFRKGGGDQQYDFMVYDLEEVLISSHAICGSGGSDETMEQFSLSFAKISWDYLTQSQDGTTSSAGKKSWDLRKNKGN